MANCIRRNALFFLTLLFLLSVSNLVQVNHSKQIQFIKV
ncbi:hypothetical protein AXX17_AT3G02180 [Arabidopsis thaliana]|uniref:Uncharacterized protein n=1 Tax=Arabidopsis thaliana TaxID=3702 RepID=A0A178VLT4_ARATH|nr:hypothetical protein AXX17_AT3G02180 [Arabidopsis thaliana]